MSSSYLIALIMSGNPESTTVINYHILSRSIAIRFIGTVNITYQHAKHQLKWMLV